MEDLTKTQLILLTLLISFVTSIGTGIITVSLLDEAPPAVTQTINRVVERTVERVVPDVVKPNTITKEVTVVVKEEDLVIDAIDKNTKSVVRIKGDGGVFIALGIVVTKEGLIVTDKQNIVSGANYTATFADGTVASVTVSKSVIEAGGLAFLQVPKEAVPNSYTFYPAVFANSDALKLGQTVIALEGSSQNSVSIGRIAGLTESSDVTATSTKSWSYIEIDINTREEVAGGPLLNLNGEIVGIKMLSLFGRRAYLPINPLKKEVAKMLAQ